MTKYCFISMWKYVYLSFNHVFMGLCVRWFKHVWIYASTGLCVWGFMHAWIYACAC